MCGLNSEGALNGMMVECELLCVNVIASVWGNEI